ncbi:autotransporter outer membrane beta-barrel domain-containing protein [Campylobacter sp. 2014D-0216]|uniref:autotransporter outer membrane beta-barrel domain-containing protein n=1 Tax=Campylobacter sp. 2014D-0216 TaxID=1813595 RepID=UPI0018A64DD6|nr:autotransporter outer membrane beta-barrel domain-containing protein [Campylobacter sp. 2014D-0216]QOR00647.1 autotransporter outer membrane beta-barrel domain-containing protein [Campylobacter sp. 2014D-0216]
MVNSSANNVTIDNQGVIKGSVSGIKVEGSTANKVTNSGTIQGGSHYGVFASGGATIHSIENSGLINGQSGIFIHASKTGTINNSGAINGTKDYGVMAYNSNIDSLNNQGEIYGRYGILAQENASIKTIKNQGSIIGNHGIYFHYSNIQTIDNQGLIFGNTGGVYIEGVNNSINHIKAEGENAIIAGGTTGIKIFNKSTIGSNDKSPNTNAIDLDNGAVIASATVKDDKLTYNPNGTALQNDGTIKGNINLNNESKIIGSVLNKNTITGNITLNGKSYITSINNEKTIQGSIDLKGNSQIGTIFNEGTIEKGIHLDQSFISSIENKGTINGDGITLANKSQVGSIINHEGAKADLDLKGGSFVGSITNNGDMTITRDDTSKIGIFNNHGNINNEFENKDNLDVLMNDEGAILEKGLDNSGKINSGIDNKGTIQQTLANSGSITIIDNKGNIESISNLANTKTKDNKDKAHIGTIINSGTISHVKMPLATLDDTANMDHAYAIYNNGTIDFLYNQANAVINGGINNEGSMNIINHGSIHNGITNTGTITLSSNFTPSFNKASEHNNGFIGKNNNGHQLENNNKGKISIDGWYFNALEYTKDNNQRLENSIIIGGDNLGGIYADNIYVNTKDLVLNQIYDSNTFFADKNGNSQGNETNNGAGVDASNIHSISGIYNFVNVGKGQYAAVVDTKELSGKTLAKSMVYASRLRAINISNMLRDITSQNFQTEFSQALNMQLSKQGEAYGNDADLLAELEDIFIPNKNPHAKNHTFLLPYYNHSNIKIGKTTGHLKVNTSGLIGGSQRELPKDYGVIGFYLGYEDSKKEQARQRLRFDDKTYYGGLTYYGVLARDGINQYYLSARTILDYTQSDIEKSYQSLPVSVESDTKVYGYGAEIKLGANYYNTLDIARISPELGLSYYGMSNKNFSLYHLGGTKEHYLAEQFNFIDASAALKWYKPWSDKLRTNLTMGAIVNLYNDAKGNLKLGTNHLSAKVETSKYYGFGQLGLSYAIAHNADLSLNYAGAFTFDDTSSHTMFLKLGLWW